MNDPLHIASPPNSYLAQSISGLSRHEARRIHRGHCPPRVLFWGFVLGVPCEKFVCDLSRRKSQTSILQGNPLTPLKNMLKTLLVLSQFGHIILITVYIVEVWHLITMMRNNTIIQSMLDCNPLKFKI